jgi:capsular exopolysaccharide synthesis family protein
MTADNPNFGPTEGSRGGQPADTGRSQLAVMPDYRMAAALPPTTNGNIWLEEPDSGEGIKFTSLLHSLRRCWLKATGWGIGLALVTALLMWWLIPISYEAYAFLQVSPVPEKILGDTKTRTSDKAYEVYKETQARLIRSPFVFSAALRKQGISQLPIVRRETNAVEWLNDELACMVSPESELIQVTLKGPDEEDVKKIVDAVLQAYMDEFVREEKTDNLRSLDILKKEWTEMKKELHQLETDFQADSKGTIAIDTVSAQAARSMAMAELSDMRRQIDKKVGDLSDAVGEMAALRAGLQSSRRKPSQYALEDILMGDIEYFEASEMYRQAERQLRDAMQRAQPGSRALVRYQAQLAAVANELERIKAKRTPWAIDRLQRMQQTDEISADTLMSQLQTRIALLRQEVEAMRKNLEERQKEFAQMNQISVDLLTKQDDIAMLQHSVVEHTMEIKRLEVNVQQLDRVKIIQNADVPYENDWLIKCLEVVGGSGLVFFLTVLGIALWDYQGKRLNSTKDISGGAMGLRVVGSLPLLDGHGAGGMWPFSRMDQRSLEVVLNLSVDSIRAALLYNQANAKIKTVMVTSAVGQEGRSTVASQLAVSLARSGRRTLLVDADIRNPQQHLVFAVEGAHGFCEVMRHELATEQSVHPTAVEGLWVMPAGRYHPLSMQALSGDRAAAVFGELKSQYDFIVIDVGPVLTSADAMLIGQQVDTALMSVRRDVSQIPKVYDACDRLRSVGVHIMGAVVNGTGTEIRPHEVEAAESVAALPQPELQPSA